MTDLYPVPANPHWRRRRISAALAGLLFLGIVRPLAASLDDDVELRVKAAFLYNFARFVEWPRQSQSDAPLSLCVLGKDALIPILEETVHGKAVNGHPLVVRRLPAGEPAEACQVMFISRSEQKRLRPLLQSLAGKPVLTVSDADNTLHEGGVIQFRLLDQSVRFDVNLDAAERAGLKISSQLLKVALSTVGKRT